jgi:Asp-tRNA(Asn)/Glu-tRNA(Gln) amidotransferase A subunit family amidase
LRQAAQADAEIMAGKYRGLLHGIPYGIKDLFAVKGYPTQWGTAAFRGQTVDENCAVFEKLTSAGAVCLAKLSLGALAMNDNWFGGRTLNPWNPKEGSSGSSAGSASAMAAGLIAFGIGTETSGSIVSPSLRCRVTGFRPTFGSVSRFGAMCLAWTMDKVGPICRTAEDAAIVLSALLGRDGRDLSSVDRPFKYRSPRDLKGIKIGVLGNAITSDYAKMLESFGAILGEFKLPRVPNGLDNIISVEGATMFDQITRDGKLNQVTENQWPQFFRSARFIPAVEYAQAERVRMKLFRDYEAAFSPFDLVLASGSAGPMIYNSNLTGHPQIHVPFKPDDKGGYTSFSLLAKPFEEHKLIGAAHLVQMKSGFYRIRPDLSKL